MAIVNDICEHCDHCYVCDKLKILDKFKNENKGYIRVNIAIEGCMDYLASVADGEDE